MGYRVKGTLKLPDGSPASNAEIEFISRKNFSPLVQELKSNILCGPTGAYDVTLEFGEYAVVLYPGGTYPAALGTITLASDTSAGQDLSTLLQQAGWQPATPEYIQQIAAWLVEANSSATSAKVSQDAAKVSEANAAASASAAASAIVTHEGKAGAHPISGVTGLQAALDGKYSPANKPTAADIQNVVSPVSAGGIIERGSNANGEYVKFADGTLICTVITQGTGIPAVISNNHIGEYGWSFYVASLLVTLPVAYILPPSCTAACRGASGGLVSVELPTNTSVRATLWGIAPYENNFSVIAIGRWK